MHENRILFSNLGKKKGKLLASFFAAGAALATQTLRCSGALQRPAVGLKSTALQRCGAFQNPALQRCSACPSLSQPWAIT
jgi:hypothetical protein